MRLLSKKLGEPCLRGIEGDRERELLLELVDDELDELERLLDLEPLREPLPELLLDEEDDLL